MPLEVDGGGGESQEQLATVWDTIGDYFASLGETVASVPIIGGILSTPFLNIAERFYMAGNVTRGFREFYDRAITGLEALASGEAWAEILDIIFPEWGQLQNWVNGIVEDITGEGITDYIRNFWRNLFPDTLTDGTFETFRLRNIIKDPTHWLRGLVPFTYPLYFDLARFNTWREFFEFLKLLGVDIFDPIAIIRSVLSSVFRWIQEHIPQFVPWLKVVGEQVLRYALEGEFTQPDIEPPIIE